jgi:hypothetical protein
MTDEQHPQDEALVRLIDHQYRPEPLRRSEMNVMLTRIRARSARPARGSWPAWGALASAGLALALWWAQPEARAPEALDALLLPTEALQVEPERRTEDLLPQDYADIETLFLEG